MVLILGTVNLLLKALVEFSTEAKKLPALSWLSESPWGIVATISVVALLAAVLLLVRGFTRRSRLADPDRLVLDPANPGHLFGRSEDIKKLVDYSRSDRLLHLVGESGVGKTALLQSGLVPRLKADLAKPELLPIYVSSYGQDWIQSPQFVVAQALWDALSAEERAKLGLIAPPEPGKILVTLSRVRATVGKIPLLIFDQFDDYQLRHRNHFLPPNRQTWLSTEELTTQNTFWMWIGKFVRNDRGHCIIATRTDAADGLNCVRFVSLPSTPRPW